jgi:hypothetical protein
MIDRDLSQTEFDIIESIIDGNGLAAFLESVSTLCGAKAEHIDPCSHNPSQDARRPRAQGNSIAQ